MFKRINYEFKDVSCLMWGGIEFHIEWCYKVTCLMTDMTDARNTCRRWNALDVSKLLFWVIVVVSIWSHFWHQSRSPLCQRGREQLGGRLGLVRYGEVCRLSELGTEWCKQWTVARPVLQLTPCKKLHSRPTLNVKYNNTLLRVWQVETH